MEQYITKERFFPSFLDNTVPKMAYLFKISGESSDCIRAMHSHERLVEVSLILRGESNYLIDGRQYSVKAGDVVILNAGIPHEERFGSDKVGTFCLGISNLHLKGREFGQLIAPGMSPVFASGEYGHMIQPLLDMIFWQQSTGEPRMEETCHYLMLSLISVLINMTDHAENQKKADMKNEALVKNICSYLNAHYMEAVTLQGVSDVFHVSKYHICHIFKDYMGCSVIQYVQRRRIGEAQSLLMETDYPVAYIGTMTGFSNPSYFNTQFTRLVGMTPLKYRSTRNSNK